MSVTVTESEDEGDLEEGEIESGDINDAVDSEELESNLGNQKGGAVVSRRRKKKVTSRKLWQ